MKTVMAKFTDDTTLLIQGVRGKISREGEIIDSETVNNLIKVSESFHGLMETINKKV